MVFLIGFSLVSACSGSPDCVPAIGRLVGMVNGTVLSVPSNQQGSWQLDRSAGTRILDTVSWTLLGPGVFDIPARCVH